MDILDKEPAERLEALREGIQWVHMGHLSLDLGDRVHIFSHSLTRVVVLVKDERGWTKDWDFAERYMAEGASPREKNEEIVRLLRLAQEDLYSHKYGARAAAKLRHWRAYQTPVLAGVGRYQFFREPESWERIRE